MSPVRVVSLVPSVTETLLAWGIVPVACTRFCEQPSLPRCGRHEGSRRRRDRRPAPRPRRGRRGGEPSRGSRCARRGRPRRPCPRGAQRRRRRRAARPVAERVGARWGSHRRGRAASSPRIGVRADLAPAVDGARRADVRLVVARGSVSTTCSGERVSRGHRSTSRAATRRRAGAERAVSVRRTASRRARERRAGRLRRRQGPLLVGSPHDRRDRPARRRYWGGLGGRRGGYPDAHVRFRKKWGCA